MYKFTGLNLSHLIECEVIQISHAAHNLLISLDPKNQINIFGGWRLFDESGAVVDEGYEGDEKADRDAYRVHHLLTHVIEQYEIVSPSVLAFVFENQWRLELIDDSDMHECCSITPNIRV